MWGQAARKEAEYAHSRLSSRRLTEAPPRCRGRPRTAWESGGRSALKPVITERELSTRISKDLLMDSVSQGARIRVRYIGRVLTQVRRRQKAISGGSLSRCGSTLALAPMCFVRKFETYDSEPRGPEQDWPRGPPSSFIPTLVTGIGLKGAGSDASRWLGSRRTLLARLQC